MSKPVLVLLSLFLLTRISYADVYLWEDGNEKVYTTNNIENVPEEYRDMVEIYKEGIEDSLDETAKGGDDVSLDEKENTTTDEESVVSDNDFSSMSAEEKINSGKSMYSLSGALEQLKAQVKAKQNKQ